MPEPLIAKLNHVSVLVADTGRALNFYVDVLGFSVDPGRGDLGYPGAWLRLNADEQIHLLQLPNPDPTDGRPNHGGRDRHLALNVPDLDVVTERLDQAGVRYTRSVSGRRALFCRDPDANALEFVELS